PAVLGRCGVGPDGAVRMKWSCPYSISIDIDTDRPRQIARRPRQIARRRPLTWNRVFQVRGLRRTVRERGLEPLRPKTLEPKSSASTNSATRARRPQQ